MAADVATLPVLDARSARACLQEIGTILYGPGVSCIWKRMYAEECKLMLDVLLANLTVGVPLRKIAFDASSICDPY